MSQDIVPDEIRRFIARYIDSVAQLEALLLLHANSAENWNVAALAQRLYAGENEIAPLLAHLRDDGFVRGRDGVYQFECETDEKRQAVDRLALVYSRHLIPVTQLIHGKPRRIRQFADAFKLKRDR